MKGTSMSTDDIYTSTDPTTARDLVYRTFSAGGCTVTPTSDYSATIERGSAAMTALFGAFAGKSRQHLKYDVQVFAGAEGGSVVRVGRANSGAMAGAVGVSRARSAFEEWRERLIAALPK